MFSIIVELRVCFRDRILIDRAIHPIVVVGSRVGVEEGALNRDCGGDVAHTACVLAIGRVLSVSVAAGECGKPWVLRKRSWDQRVSIQLRHGEGHGGGQLTTAPS